MNLKDIIKIFIIESPSAIDLLDDRKEGYSLSQILGLAEIQNQYFNVSNTETLKEAFKRIRTELISSHGKYGSICIHFSMHGNKDGIGLTNGDFLSWDDLYKILKDFNDSNGYMKGIAGIKKPFAPINIYLSVCEGFRATIIKNSGDESPYQSLVAPISQVNWSDSLIAFATFYHNTIHRTNGVKSAVEKMNLASGLDNIFRLDTIEGLVPLDKREL